MNGAAKLYAISDNAQMLAGLALAGIPSQAAHTPDELSRALEIIPSDIGIVIVTSGLAAKSADVLEKHREKELLPMLTVVPEPGG